RDGLVTADQPRLREALLEVTRQGIPSIAQQDRADAPVGGGHQDRSERGLADGEADRCLIVSGAEWCRCHGQLLLSAVGPRGSLGVKPAPVTLRRGRESAA